MPRSFDPLAIALLLAMIAVLVLSWLCYRLLVDRGRLLLRVEEEAADARAARQQRGLPAGAYLSDFALPVLGGADATRGVATLSALTGRPLLIIFLRAECLYSRALARELAQQERASGAPLPVSIVVGESDSQESLFSDLPGLVLLDAQGQVARLMRIRATPSGYFVDVTRRTVGPMLAGPESLLAVARGEPVVEPSEAPSALTPLPDRSSRPAPLAHGEAAPDFTLPAVAGGAWSLAAHRGTPLTLIFADPDCPPCVALLSTLAQRDTSGMVIVSRGDETENRRLAAATGITAPILLQHKRDVGRAYRTLETPAAFAIGEAGEIVAGPAIGNDAVLALIAPMDSGRIRSTDVDARPT